MNTQTQTETANANMKKMILNHAKTLMRERGTSTPVQWDWSELYISEVGDNGVVCLHAEYRLTYSKGYQLQYGKPLCKSSYLMGLDDGGWVVRIPATIEYVQEGIDWITPLAAKRATEKGLTVYRQGDIYLIPKRIKEHDLSLVVDTSHTAIADGDTVIMTHPMHDTLKAVAPKGYKFRAIEGKEFIGGGGD